MTTLLVLSILTTAELMPPVIRADNEELRGYLIEAAENNPGLRAQHDEWLAALEKVPQVKSLDDPMFTYAQFIQSDVSRLKVGLAQKFPWFGTLHAKGNKALAEADAERERLYAERNRVFSEIKKAYFEYAFLAESIRVTESQMEVLSYMEDTVASKMSLGFANEDELLRVSIEKTKTQDRRDGFLQFRPALMARLREAMGRDGYEEIPWPQEIGFPAQLPPTPTILVQVRTANPDLRAFDHLLESRKEQIALAKKKGYPDFTLGFEYGVSRQPRTSRPDRPYPATLNAANRMLSTVTGATPFSAANTAIDLYSLGTMNEPITYPDSRDDNIMVSLNMNIPLWRRKVNAGIREAKLLESATRHRKRKMQFALESSAERTIFTIEDALRRYTLFEASLIPQAQSAYESLQSQYASSSWEVTFLDVLDSIQTLLNFELEHVRAGRDWRVGTAELEFLMGGSWPDSEDTMPVEPVSEHISRK